MVDLDFEAKFKKVISKIEESGNHYAEKKAHSWMMQQLKSSVLAKISKTFGEIPVSKAESLANASSEYEEYIKTTAEAIKEEYQAKAEYEKWLSSFEALRSLSSLEKSTRNYVG